jgi:hypothetical protein
MMIFQTASKARQWRRKALRGVKKLTGPALSDRERVWEEHAWRRKRREREQALKSDPDARRYQRLRAELLALSKRLVGQLERRYGVLPFHELQALFEGVEGPNYDRLYKNEPYARDVTFSPLFEIGQEARMWQRCAEAERVVLGEATATTAGKIADRARLARRWSTRRGRSTRRASRSAALSGQKESACTSDAKQSPHLIRPPDNRL